jgi:hypothetical protein
MKHPSPTQQRCPLPGTLAGPRAMPLLDSGVSRQFQSLHNEVKDSKKKCAANVSGIEPAQLRQHFASVHFKGAARKGPHHHSAVLNFGSIGAYASAVYSFCGIGPAWVRTTRPDTWSSTPLTPQL